MEVGGLCKPFQPSSHVFEQFDDPCLDHFGTCRQLLPPEAIQDRGGKGRDRMSPVPTQVHVQLVEVQGCLGGNEFDWLDLEVTKHGVGCVEEYLDAPWLLEWHQWDGRPSP